DVGSRAQMSAGRRARGDGEAVNARARTGVQDGMHDVYEVVDLDQRPDDVATLDPHRHQLGRRLRIPTHREFRSGLTLPAAAIADDDVGETDLGMFDAPGVDHLFECCLARGVRAETRERTG